MKRVSIIAAVVCALSLFLIGGKVHAGCVMPPAGLVSWWPADGHTYDVVNTNRSYFIRTNLRKTIFQTSKFQLLKKKRLYR